jgi:hypothetical protein
MKRKYTIQLSQQERKEIQKTLNSNIVSATIKKRASILLLADQSAGKPMVQEEIAVRCGVSGVTVFNTLRDYCTNGLEYTLKFKRIKATNPPIVTGDIEAKIIALVCGQVPAGYSRWTIRLLTERIVELHILDDISRETVRTTLKKLNLGLT